jgi:hypothetical protein
MMIQGYPAFQDSFFYCPSSTNSRPCLWYTKQEIPEQLLRSCIDKLQIIVAYFRVIFCATSQAPRILILAEL